MRNGKIKTFDIGVNHNEWYMILQGLKLKENQIREEMFYHSTPEEKYEKYEKLIELLKKVGYIVNITEPPSIKRARASIMFE